MSREEDLTSLERISAAASRGRGRMDLDEPEELAQAIADLFLMVEHLAQITRRVVEELS
jgi:hypothetical protein